MTEINLLFKKGIIWQAAKDHVGKWHSDFNGEKCFLQMNDFPDEPLYTLTFKGETVDFDDKPLMWFIPIK